MRRFGSTGTCMTTQRQSYESGHKPKCLVIVDDTAEWVRAVYYASRWAIRVGGGEFATAMTDIAQWGEVTLIVHTDDAIFEFTGAIPAGEVGRGYFNLMQPKGLHGHLRHERCAAVAFVERPFMGKTSAFVAFVNADGGIMFKVFVGRDETRALRADQLARFRQLADRLAAKPAT